MLFRVDLLVLLGFMMVCIWLGFMFSDRFLRIFLLLMWVCRLLIFNIVIVVLLDRDLGV